MFISAPSVCKSLKYLTSALTQGDEGGHLFRLTCSTVLREGGTWQTNTTGMCGERSQCLGHTGFAPLTRSVCFPRLHCSGSRLLCRELSKAGPGLCALPRSTPLRLRFTGTPQRHGLSWACVLCPSQVQAAQVTRCLTRALLPARRCVSSTPRSQPLGFLGAQRERRLRCAGVSSGALISGCDPPDGCPLSRIPGRLG